MPALITRRAPRSPDLDPRRVKRVCERMLAELNLCDAELSVLLTDDSTMAAMNLEHRGKGRPTDVLAFPQHVPWPPPHPAQGRLLLGDIVISLDTAARQASGRRRDLLAEVRLLLAHGILHLIGHDHDTRDKKRVMDRETRRLVRAAAV